MIKTLIFICLAGSFALIACSTPEKSKEIPADKSALKIPNLPNSPNSVNSTKSVDSVENVLAALKPGQPRDESPSTLRFRFSKLLQDRRAMNDRELRDKRDEYRKNEKANRDQFLAKINGQRDAFMKTKSSGAERTAFFKRLDVERHAYFTDESDRRRQFESGLSETRKVSETANRKANEEFSDAIRAYTSDYEKSRKVESPKPAGDKLPIPVLDDGDRELLKKFEKVPKGPSTPLAPTK